MTAPLRGCTVVVTREERGELGRLLDAQGADVVHVPLIEVVDADSMSSPRRGSREPDWLIVTSAAGAERVAATSHSDPERPPRRRGVGDGTAARGAVRPPGRPRPRLVSSPRHWSRNSWPGTTRPCRVLVAQADRAAPTLVDGLRAAGHEVTAVVAYRTRLRPPTAAELASIERCRCRGLHERIGSPGLGGRTRGSAERCGATDRGGDRADHRRGRRRNQGSRSPTLLPITLLQESSTS